MPNDKPYAAACERNREPILAVLGDHFHDRQHVLEIGSGTGQHAVFFATALPHLKWQTSDRADNISGICAWLDEAHLPNTPAPLELDVDAVWNTKQYDAVYSANTLHIMSWPQVERLFQHLRDSLADQGKLVIYGPFKYGGEHTAPSNAAFDASLKSREPHMGIRDFEAVNQLAEGIGLSLIEDRAMAANNRCLVWHRT